MSIWDFEGSVVTQFRTVARRQPDAPALILAGGEMSYGKMLDFVEQVAGGLAAAHTRKGDRIVVNLGNRAELVPIYLACLAVGAVLVTINQRMSEGEAKRILAHSGARFYIGDSTQFGKWAGLVDRQETIERAWVLDLDAARQSARVRPYSDLIARQAPLGQDPQPDDIATIFYTSGTTGTSKGVAYSHASLRAAAGFLFQMFTPTEASRPGRDYILYSMFDLIVPWNIVMSLAAMGHGCAVMVTDTTTPDAVLPLLRTRKINWMSGPPSTFKALLDAARNTGDIPPDLSATNCVAGGDACSVDLSRDFLETFHARLQSCYGQTEIGPVLFQSDLIATDVPSIGWPLPGVEIGIDAPAGEAGILSLRSPSLAVGLWNGSGIDRFDPDRWLPTEDIVRRRDDGCLLFLGRQQDLIKIGGYAASPLEIEQYVVQHPDIAGAVIFSVPDPQVGARIVALVQPVDGRAIDARSLSAFLKGTIADYKHPSDVVVVDAVPVLPNGKLGRKRLAEEYVASRSAA